MRRKKLNLNNKNYLINMKQRNIYSHGYDTIIVPVNLEYEASIICDVEPSKTAMKNYIKRIEKTLEKIRSRYIYKIFNKIKLI